MTPPTVNRSHRLTRESGGDQAIYNAPIVVPNPDPSDRTQQAIDRAFNSLQDVLDPRLASIDTRFNAIDRATDKFEANLTRVPTQLQTAISEFKQLVEQMLNTIDQKFATQDEKFSTVNERFGAVNREFQLLSEFSNQSALDRKEELKTALSAAEKAVDKQATNFGEATDKSEKTTGELLRQQAELLRTTKEGIETTLNDLKVRLAIAEAKAAAASESAATSAATAAAVIQSNRADRNEHRSDNSLVAYIILTCLAIVVALASMGVAIFKP